MKHQLDVKRRQPSSMAHTGSSIPHGPQALIGLAIAAALCACGPETVPESVHVDHVKYSQESFCSCIKTGTRVSQCIQFTDQRYGGTGVPLDFVTNNELLHAECLKKK